MRNRIFEFAMIAFLIATMAGAWRIAHSPEVVARRCATYDLNRVFDDCVKQKSCAMRDGRFAEWGGYVSYRSNTYDCPTLEILK